MKQVFLFAVLAISVCATNGFHEDAIEKEGFKIDSNIESLNYKECYGQPYGKCVHYTGDCTKFIVCEGHGIVQNCPASLHFNARLEVCDWPQSAKCPWW